MAEERQSGEPKFMSLVHDWIEKQGSEENPLMDEISKLTHYRDISIRQQELVTLLRSQPQLREKVKQIPGFWPFTFTRCSTFARACTSEKDWDALGYLKDMEFVIDPRDYRAFDIVFHFAENPYFTNQTLTKSYVPHTGPSHHIGLTASELIGRPRPSDLSDSPKGQGETKVEKVEGEWDIQKVEQATGDEVKQDIAIFDEMDDLVGLETKIHWKSDEVNLCKLFPRDDPEADAENDEYESGDRGSFFWFFSEKMDVDGLASILVQDVLPNCMGYFEGNGADNDSDMDDSMDEEDESDDDAEIDLVSDIDDDEKDQLKRQSTSPESGRPRKKVKAQ